MVGADLFRPDLDQSRPVNSHEGAAVVPPLEVLLLRRQRAGARVGVVVADGSFAGRVGDCDVAEDALL